ncbi:MAG: hypothetical protein II536_04610 [Clostridia bacterium]|nr:hypothetical protein [Clostridia bacterium]
MKRLSILPLLLALLMLAGCTSPAVNGNTQAGGKGNGYLLAAPADRAFAKHPSAALDENGEGDYSKYYKLENEWSKALDERRNAGETPDMGAFAQRLTGELARACGNGNLFFSPANIYIALAMLTECAEGETRAELLSALGAKDGETLGKKVAALIKAESNDDGVAACLPANSIWMQAGAHKYSDELLNKLAQEYGASSYSGSFAEKGFTDLMRAWLNEHTGGLLKDSVNELDISADTVVALASAIYFKNSWQNKFFKGDTKVETFRGANGDTTCSMMHVEADHIPYYEGDGFRAAALEMEEGACCWVLLPDEGASPDSVVGKGLELAKQGMNAMNSGLKVHVAMPKLDITSDFDLIPALQKMGVNKCFTEAAELDRLTEDENGLFVSQVRHSARIIADEEGVEAAAFTVIAMPGSAEFPPELERAELILDRPFAFIITGLSGAPLFIGTVNELG